MTLTVLAFAFAALAYVATTQDVLEEGRDKKRVYVPSTLKLWPFLTVQLVEHMLQLPLFCSSP